MAAVGQAGTKTGPMRRARPRERSQQGPPARSGLLSQPATPLNGRRPSQSRLGKTLRLGSNRCLWTRRASLGRAMALDDLRHLRIRPADGAERSIRLTEALASRGRNRPSARRATDGRVLLQGRPLPRLHLLRVPDRPADRTLNRHAPAGGNIAFSPEEAARAKTAAVLPTPQETAPVRAAEVWPPAAARASSRGIALLIGFWSE